MVSGFKTSSGADLDTIFAARIGTAAANTGFKNSAGVDLAQLFEAGSMGVHPTDTGFRTSAGTDLRNIFSTIAGPAPRNFPASGTHSRSSGTATVTITAKTDGSLTVLNSLGASAGSGTSYLNPVTAGFGQYYDIEFVKGAVNAVGAASAGGLAGGSGVWYQLNADRAVSLTCAGSSGNYNTGEQTITCRLRRRSDLAIVATATWNLSVESGL